MKRGRHSRRTVIIDLLQRPLAPCGLIMVGFRVCTSFFFLTGDTDDGSRKHTEQQDRRKFFSEAALTKPLGGAVVFSPPTPEYNAFTQHAHVHTHNNPLAFVITVQSVSIVCPKPVFLFFSRSRKQDEASAEARGAPPSSSSSISSSSSSSQSHNHRL